jgi:hypothetical protein
LGGTFENVDIAAMATCLCLRKSKQSAMVVPRNQSSGAGQEGLVSCLQRESELPMGKVIHALRR